MSMFYPTPFVGTQRLSSTQLRSTFETAAALVNGELDGANLSSDSVFALSQLAEQSALVVWTVPGDMGSAVATVTRTIPVWQEMRLLGASLYRHKPSGSVSCSAKLEALGANGAAARVLWNDSFADTEDAQLQHWAFQRAATGIVLPARSFARVTLAATTTGIDFMRLQLYFSRALVGVR